MSDKFRVSWRFFVTFRPSRCSSWPKCTPLAPTTCKRSRMPCAFYRPCCRYRFPCWACSYSPRWLSGTVEPVMPVYLPGIEFMTVRGYCISLVINVGQVLCAAIGFIGADLTVFLLLLHVCSMSDVFVSHLAALQLRLEHVIDADVDQHSRRYLFNIVRMHSNICSYILSLRFLLRSASTDWPSASCCS